MWDNIFIAKVFEIVPGMRVSDKPKEHVNNICKLLLIFETTRLGGGINEKNIERILEGCKAKEFHGSARCSRPSQMRYQCSSVPMGAALYPPEYINKTSDVNKIKSMIEISKCV